MRIFTEPEISAHKFGPRRVRVVELHVEGEKVYALINQDTLAVVSAFKRTKDIVEWMLDSKARVYWTTDFEGELPLTTSVGRYSDGQSGPTGGPNDRTPEPLEHLAGLRGASDGTNHQAALGLGRAAFRTAGTGLIAWSWRYSERRAGSHTEPGDGS